MLEAFKQNISALELEPASGGCYEISVDGALVYSKLATGEFPSDQAIADKLSSLG